MNREDLAFAGAAAQAELVRKGEVSSRELVELYLERIERIDRTLNCYRTVMAERALADADQADARRSAGDDRPLLGVPMAVKDNQDVAGEITTHGTGAYGAPASRDAEVVTRLRAAGAVVLGKTTLPELAIMGSTESLNWGVTRNPWNPDRTPGGSSGGSGAAVAAGLAAAATASDGAGSIRIPAACCGLFGLKPQRGRVTLAPAAEHWHGMSVAGYLTRSVRDTALLLDVTAAPAPGDADRPDPPTRPFAEAAATPPGTLRIATSTRPFFPVPRLDDDVVRAFEETVGVLGALGHRVARRDPQFGQASNGVTIRYLRGIRDDAVQMPRPERLQRRTKGFVRLGSLLPDAAVRWARAQEPRFAARINAVFDDADVLVMPATRTPPVAAARWEGLSGERTFLSMVRSYPYTAIWNMTGQPAAVVPAGLSGEGLPIGVQLVGRPGDEATLLSLAAQLEAERPWAERRPPVS